MSRLFTAASAALLLAALFAPRLAAADHPVRPIFADGTAPIGGFVASEAAPDGDSDGVVFARQVLPPRNQLVDDVAESRIIYLNHTGVTLSPGDNNSFTQTSSIVNQRATIAAWDTPMWPDVLACVTEIYSRFDVTVTDVDPGNVPHIEAVFGGSPADVGLPGNVGGVSPFTTDCAIIDNSIVFAFTDNLPVNARRVCEVMSQEIAHSYGLDHEMLASDPMTYLDYTGNREFQDESVTCGEFTARACGINGSSCRDMQDSVQLLNARVGLSASAAAASGITASSSDGEITGGCAASRTTRATSTATIVLGVGLVIAGLLRRRRR